MFLRAVLAAVIVVGMGAVTARALVVLPRDFSDLVSRAEFIVEGTVGRIEEAPDEAGIQRTLVHLYDLMVHKGTWSAPDFSVDIAGGSKDGWRSQVSELPNFTSGERVILFVRGNGRQVFPIVGVHQGYFRVVADGDGRPVVVRCDGQPVIGRDARALRFAPRSAVPPQHAVSADEFRQWIREEMHRHEEQSP